MGVLRYEGEIMYLLGWILRVLRGVATRIEARWPEWPDRVLWMGWAQVRRRSLLIRRPLALRWMAACLKIS